VKLENFYYRYAALFEESKPDQPQGFPGKAPAVRIRGGYYSRPADGDGKFRNCLQMLVLIPLAWINQQINRHGC
jgi:hypothetical protein